MKKCTCNNMIIPGALVLAGIVFVMLSYQPARAPVAVPDHEHAPGTPEHHDHDAAGQPIVDHAAHQHEMRELTAADGPLPAVDLTIHEDPKAGWNLEVATTNFRFAPEHASQAHQPGEGHAHIFINGEKLTRLYGRWYYLESLPSGTHEITVDLNGNDHTQFVIDGVPVADTETVVVP